MSTKLEMFFFQLKACSSCFRIDIIL